MLDKNIKNKEKNNSSQDSWIISQIINFCKLWMKWLKKDSEFRIIIEWKTVLARNDQLILDNWDILHIVKN